MYKLKWENSYFSEEKFISPTYSGFGFFGCSVVTSTFGEELFLGALKEDSSMGSSYYFNFNENPPNVTRLTADDGMGGDEYGVGVGMSGDGSTLLVGSYQADISPNGSQGAAYVYTRNNDSWLSQKLIASDADVSDRFGWHVAVSRDASTLIVGAITGDGSVENSGCAYLYKKNGSNWVETYKFYPSDSSGSDRYGRIVAISEDGRTIAIGAYGHSLSGSNHEGAVYVYRLNGSLWIEEKITASDAAQYDCFGYSVSVSADGNKILVGALECDVDGKTNQGAAYFYSWNGASWDETKYTASDGAANDLYGYSVHISGDGSTLMVGAPNHDGEKGAVYIY